MTGTATALILARAQFAFTVSFHFIFPAFSIGLASYLAVLEALWLKTHNAVYDNLFRYWVKIFALVFGMGVVSGLVMSYQFGTNWSVFSDKAGPIIGPLMAYEVMSAFFLEAGFLGVMLFGIKKVGPRLHFFATCMVALGTLLAGDSGAGELGLGWLHVGAIGGIMLWVAALLTLVTGWDYLHAGLTHVAPLVDPPRVLPVDPPLRN